ncbi:MAG: hypothetical protein ACI8TE_000806 [Francisella sp.]
MLKFHGVLYSEGATTSLIVTPDAEVIKKGWNPWNKTEYVSGVLIYGTANDGNLSHLRDTPVTAQYKTNGDDYAIGD